MICIDDEALDLISGGYYGPVSSAITNVSAASPDPDIPVVVIHGYAEPEPSTPVSAPGFGGGSVPVSTPVSAPGGAPPDPCAHHSTPMPNARPLSVDGDVLRNTALDVANQIKQLDPAIEHGAMIFQKPDGTLRVGEMKHGTEGGIDLGFSPIKGEVVVGYIHSHPADTLDQRLPSKWDIDQANQLRKNVYADSNLLMYILDDKSGDVYEYSKNSDGKKAGSDVSTDMCKG